MKELIRDEISDTIAKFIFYDRKEDENLPLGAIEKAIENEEITLTEIIDMFEVALIEGLK